MGLLGSIRNLLVGSRTLKKLKADGLEIGRDVHIGPMCFIDPTCCWLISIGDGSTLAPRVTILAHDASTKRQLGFTKIGRVAIGRNVFVGAGAIILPGVSIGDGSIVGAGSVVTRDVPADTVVAGSPAVAIAQVSQLVEKHRAKMKDSAPFDPGEFPVSQGISAEQKKKMRESLKGRIGYIE